VDRRPLFTIKTAQAVGMRARILLALRSPYHGIPAREGGRKRNMRDALSLIDTVENRDRISKRGNESPRHVFFDDDHAMIAITQGQLQGQIAFPVEPDRACTVIVSQDESVFFNEKPSACDGHHENVDWGAASEPLHSGGKSVE
jgi:hypothetical protein